MGRRIFPKTQALLAEAPISKERDELLVKGKSFIHAL